jgi:SET domain-containing protein
MSAINHSCWPNADKIDDVNGPAAVWTIRDIAAGDSITTRE